ncbi:class II aldolase/adducin family protein [Chelativorans salis]|uniref:class II aldolase/adducin family protein n=1 Tax=Chelativorans salis TaxID=2978478 RepID=UPI0028CB6330|nr:class II aldolase/adducin family protein [Chelativorans sp. EGI FJ00035]
MVLANRILSHEGIIDSFGHVNVRHPLHKDRYLLSRSRSPANLTRGDIMEFTQDGEKIGDDPRSPYKERHIHGAIYKDRPDVNAVTHHHARPIIPFTMNKVSLRPMFHMAAVIRKEIPTWDSQDEFGDTHMLLDSMEMGHSLSKVLGQNSVALLRGHGCVCVAQNLNAVCLVSMGARDNAEPVHQTMQIGEVTALTDGEIDMASELLLNDMALARAWDYWIARAGFAGL